MLPASTLRLIKTAIEEDIGPGDVTSQFFIPAKSRSKARLVAREAGIASGIEVAAAVFRMIDRGIQVKRKVRDGQSFRRGSVLMEVEGKTRSLLAAERTALNFLQRLCGVATMTGKFLRAMKPHRAKLLDTRKTTPGWRLLEKAAVRHGGGTNHRMGLHDQVMVKDNHLRAVLPHPWLGDLSPLQKAIDRVKAKHPRMKVQIEADSPLQVAACTLLRGVDMLLLDNMSPFKLKLAVEIADGKFFLEASGGITLETIRKAAATGVDAISVGALTHSARAVDLALDFV